MNCFGATQAVAPNDEEPPPTPHSLPLSPPQTPNTATPQTHHRPKYRRKSSLSGFLGSLLLPSSSGGTSSRSRSRPPSPPDTPAKRRSWAPGHRPQISHPLPLNAYPFDPGCELSCQLRAAFEGTPSVSSPSAACSPSLIAATQANMERAGSTNSMLLHPAAATSGRLKQIKDAQDVGRKVLDRSKKAGIAPPPYEFLELIGKGTFGRVYKSRRKGGNELVAVKIIDVDSQDYKLAPSEKDQAIKDFLTEIQILHTLKDSRAKNINIIHEAFNFHSQLWIVSEYCPGGSVHTLMKASPKPGLEEKFIIAISRELAVALKHVHEAGIIHRDVKAANVLITQDGQLQLCDFGVSGILESNVAKRSTIIGTPFWMAPELHAEEGGNSGYGTEVDCWAFGCTVYELATGQPPNANIAAHRLHLFLQKAPRLEGGEYSAALREFVSFCLEERPQERPSAEKILKHSFVANTSKKYPTVMLRQLIERFANWETAGGQRASLFQPYGATAPTATDPFAIGDDDDWNFSTTDDFAEEVLSHFSPRTPDMSSRDVSDDETPKQRKSSKTMTPFEKAKQEQRAARGARQMARLFDESAEPYEYHLEQDENEMSEPYSDLPFRRTSAARAADRETIIDLDAARVSQDLSTATNLDLAGAETIRANKQRFRYLEDFDYEEEEEQIVAEREAKRFTRDWKFPPQAQTARPRTLEWTMAQAMAQSTSLGTSTEESSPTSDAPPRRPGLKHTVTEPVGNFGDFVHPNLRYEGDDDENRTSMIDLDEAGMGTLHRQASFASSASTEFDINPFYHDEDPDMKGAHQHQQQSDVVQIPAASPENPMAQNQDTLRAKRQARTSTHAHSHSDPSVADRSSDDPSARNRIGSLSSDTEFERHHRSGFNNGTSADAPTLQRSVSTVSLSDFSDYDSEQRHDPAPYWQHMGLTADNGRGKSFLDASQLQVVQKYSHWADMPSEDEDPNNDTATDIDTSEAEGIQATQRRIQVPHSQDREQSPATAFTSKLTQGHTPGGSGSSTRSQHPTDPVARRTIGNATAANAAAALSLSDSHSRYHQQAERLNVPRNHRRGRRGRSNGSIATGTSTSGDTNSERMQSRAAQIMAQFPAVQPVDPTALEENADPDIVETELGRLLDGFLDGLHVAKTLMEHTDVVGASGAGRTAGSGSSGGHSVAGSFARRAKDGTGVGVGVIPSEEE